MPFSVRTCLNNPFDDCDGGAVITSAPSSAASMDMDAVAHAGDEDFGGKAHNWS